MNLATRAKVTLSALALGGLEGIHEMHYVISHANTIIPMAAGGVGLAAIWCGSGIKTAIAARKAEAKLQAQPLEQAQAQGQEPRYVQQLPQAQWSPRADKQVIDMTAPVNAQRITRL